MRQRCEPVCSRSLMLTCSSLMVTYLGFPFVNFLSSRCGAVSGHGLFSLVDGSVRDMDMDEEHEEKRKGTAETISRVPPVPCFDTAYRLGKT